jgi:YVTN family beta-propeller protein
MRLDDRSRRAGEAIRRYAEVVVDPTAMLADLRRHERRRRTQAMAVALGMSIVLLAATVLTVQLARHHEAVSPPPKPVGRVVQRIQVGAYSGLGERSVYAGLGYVWWNNDNATLSRLKPTTGKITTLPLGSANAALGAVGLGAFWTQDLARGTVTKHDPGTGDPLATIGIGIPTSAGALPPGPRRIAIGAGAVWVAHPDGKVLRIDPTHNQVTATIKVGSEPWGVAADDRSVLVISGNGVDVIDPASTRLVASLKPCVEPADLIAQAGVGWVVCHDGTLARIDLEQRRVVATIQLGSSGDSIAAGPGAIWVNVPMTDLMRIDPASNRIVGSLRGISRETYDGALVSGDDGTVWVVDLTTLIRVDPQG